MPFALGAITDEIAPEMEQALEVMVSEGIRLAELRTVFGRNVLELDDTQARRALTMVRAAGCTVSGVASPVGKSPLGAPRETEERRLGRALELAALLETDRIRIFSYYPEPGQTAAQLAALAPEVCQRLERLSALAATHGVTLLLENEVDLWGDVPERCRQLLATVDSPHLRFAWDPANFVRSGVAAPQDAGWSLLAPWVACAHVKDCDAQGVHTVAGRGAGQWPQLLRDLEGQGGVPLILEPHLRLAGRSEGFSGPDAFRQAVSALRQLLPA